MSFSSAGEFRVVLQQYKYGQQQIVCIFKIHPDRVTYFEKEPENDFNWMTAARWSKLESGLWRMFASISNWPENTHKLKSHMLIDHINVSVAPSEEFVAAAAHKILQNDVLGQNDLGLLIELKYMSHEDKTISSSQSTKRRHVDKVKATHLNYESEKQKSKFGDTSSSLKKKLSSRNGSSDQVQKTDDLVQKKRPESEASNRKRERRSISQTSHSSKGLSQDSRTNITPSGASTSKRPKSPISRSNSVESKPERRSARSPVKPNRYNEFILDEIISRKVKNKPVDNNTNSSSDKGSSKKLFTTKAKSIEPAAANGKDTNFKFEQLDGARINMVALKEINDMLDVPKPRKVEILLLKDMDECAVLNTFNSYRSDFDKLFKERQHKYQTTNFKTIDHCHIMDILNPNIRDSMIKKLGDTYSKSGPHGSLILNGLLPLWIIRLFMDKYKFTQEEAVQQIGDQLKYHTYLKALNNEPLSSDLED